MTPALVNTSHALIRERASALASVRSFFHALGVLEVDCPILSPRASVDAYIDLISASCQGEKRYLHSSPEYGMKRLLARGAPDIYQLSHVFRDGEVGEKHNPEFTLIEWYRKGFSFQEIIDETLELISLFAGKRPRQQYKYWEAMEHFAGVCKGDDLKAALDRHDITPYEGIKSQDEYLNLLMGTVVEPKMDKSAYTIITHYPKSQAALARLDGDTALRFEVYTAGLELANGYDELRDPGEQKARFDAVGSSVPLDDKFLAILQDMPPCCGVAVGFDRLLMLQLGAKKIQDVLPFSWEDA